MILICVNSKNIAAALSNDGDTVSVVKELITKEEFFPLPTSACSTTLYITPEDFYPWSLAAYDSELALYPGQGCLQNWLLTSFVALSHCYILKPCRYMALSQNWTAILVKHLVSVIIMLIIIRMMMLIIIINWSGFRVRNVSLKMISSWSAFILHQ